MNTDASFGQRDLVQFARAIERDCQEGVPWERRKLEWILESEREPSQIRDEIVSEVA